MKLQRASVSLCVLLCTGAALGHQDQLNEMSLVLEQLDEMSSSSFLMNQKAEASDRDEMRFGQLTDSIQGLFKAKSSLKQGVVKSKLEMTSEMSAASFLNLQKEASTGLDDNKMSQLTDSIQGLFDTTSLALAANPAKVAASAPASVEKAPTSAKPKVQTGVDKPVKVSGKKVFLVEAGSHTALKSASARVTKTVATKTVAAAAPAKTVEQKFASAFLETNAAAPARTVEQKFASAFLEMAAVAPAKTVEQKFASAFLEMAAAAPAKTVEQKFASAFLEMAAAAPVQPKAIQSVAPKVPTTVATIVQPQIVKAKTVKAVAKSLQVKTVKAAATKISQAVAKPAQAQTVKAVAPKILQAVAKPAQAKSMKAVAPKISQAVPKPSKVKTMVVAPKIEESDRAKALEQEVAELKQRLAQASKPAALKPVVHDAVVAAPVHGGNPASDSIVPTGSQSQAIPSRSWWSPVTQWVSPFFSHMGLAAEVTKKKGLSLISSWSQMAQQNLDTQASVRSADKSEQEKGDSVRSGDQSVRDHAKTSESEHTQDAIEGRQGTGADVSSYWGELEEQDGQGAEEQD